MSDLYDAIGTLASAAHANGDEIDENTYPSDDDNARHGLDVFADGHYVMFRAVPNEPRFTIGCPYTFVSRLQSQYTADELSERADVNFVSLASDQQEQVINQTIQTDLQVAEEHENEFKTTVTDELGPGSPDVIRLEYGEQNRWNGVLVRDRVFPQRTDFGHPEYRDAIDQIRQTKMTVAELLSSTIPPLNDDNEDHTSPSATQTKEDARPIGFQ
ncbi:hypothetical protein DJ82_06610 [Halorubrum sp. Ib24]|uniref:hypothetical protein n=1 Tax=Halorubrum sp. Ib24 TaxID=1383850 RepID=UPI000B97E784|nr:hypothetical protein [Halorubrum sp. Ib24]OYR40758.1 hypothetical protein DJ82_06610 [Halorubrum sp. Ib24]